MKRRAGRRRSPTRAWRAAERSSVDASGGSPRSSQEPSPRRTSSSRSASSLSAVETVGRRAPTSWPRMRWVSASGMTTPSPPTRPQRSARCQNSAFRRRSTRVSCEIACVVASRSERSDRRSNSAAVISGHCAISAAKRRSSTASVVGESTVHSASTGSSPVFDAACHGRIRSPGPSSSALTWSATISSRAITPSSTSRPMWSALAFESRDTSHEPTASRWVLTSSLRSASARRASASRPPRSGSAFSSGICSVLIGDSRGRADGAARCSYLRGASMGDGCAGRAARPGCRPWRSLLDCGASAPVHGHLRSERPYPTRRR